MKIVFDTNVLIAALITRGVSSSLFDHCVQQHQLITSNFILGELRRHLLGKFKYAPADVQATLDLLGIKMEVVIPLPLPEPVCRDPDDDAVLGTAIAGKADCIITGDKDLLVLQQYQTIDILAPAQFADYEGRGK